MVGAPGIDVPLKPVETLRAMLALRDNNPDPLAKRLYAMANPRLKSGSLLRFIVSRGAFSMEILSHELGVNKNTMYPLIRELVSLGVLHNGYEIDLGKPGINAIMYVLDGVDPSLVLEAHRFHLELKRTTSVGVLAVDSLRKLVLPLIQDAVDVLQPKADGDIPESMIMKPFREKHGYYSDEVRSVVHAETRKLGFYILY